MYALMLSIFGHCDIALTYGEETDIGKLNAASLLAHFLLKNTEQNSACSSSPLAGAALTVTTLFRILASLPFGQWRCRTSGGHRYG